MKKIIYLLSIFILIFGLSSCMYDTNKIPDDSGSVIDPDTGEEYKSYSGGFASMGTYISLQVYSTSKEEADNIYNGIKSIYDTYNSISDDGYDSIYGQSYDSELARLNRDRSLKVSDELYDLLKFAVSMQEYTNGYYNPFMGRLNHMWKDYINYVGTMPSQGEQQIYASIARNTYLEFGEDNLVTIKNDLDEIYPGEEPLIDLGGCAKGYATNIAYNYLVENNVKYYLLNAGSSNLLMGEKPSKDGYNVILSYVYGYPNQNPVIEIKDGYWYIDGRNTNLEAKEGAKSYYGSKSPDSKNGKEGDLYFLFNSQVCAIYIKEGSYWRNKLNWGIANINVENEAVVTSSPSEQHRLEDGIYYHHLLSPVTGKPENYIDGISVIGTDSGKLDALSTALFVMPDDIREEYIVEHNLEVIISKDGKISYETVGLTNENALV